MIKKMRFLTVALSLMIATVMNAQVTTSSMSGRVTDKEGAVIGATVVATHQPSGSTYGTVTNMDGRYVLTGMRVGGPYKIEVSYIGFGTDTKSDVSLSLGENYEYSVVLKEETVSLGEVVIVGDRGAVFNSQRTGAATNFNRTAIDQTPSISRSIFDVTRLTPQASAAGAGISFAGSNNKYNSFQIDGTVNNDVFGLSSSGTNGGQSGANPISLEAIEEVQVVIAPFDVRQSGFTGGGVNAITKSGTNKFHGSLYNYFNNQNFVGTTPGKDVEERTKLSKQSSNTYGVTLGGAIVKNKLFFFTNYEHVKETYPSSYNVGDGSNITAEEANLVINKLKEISSGYDGGGYGAIDVPTKSDKFLARMDWNINNVHKLTARYSYLNARRLVFSNSANNLNLNNSGYYMNNKTHSVVAELNSRFSPEWSNELRIGYTQVRDFREIMGTPFPYVRIRLDNNRNIYLGSERYSVANTLDQDIFTISDNLTWLRGNHQITFGTHNEFFKMKNLFIRENYGSYDYVLDNFMKIGTPEEAAAPPRQYDYSFSREDITGSKRWAPSFGSAQLGFYVQDEWAVNNLFKLTMGLRADIPLFFDKPGANTTFNELALAQEYKIATDQMPKTRVLFSPRVGFRYHANENRTTLIRGGLGIFTGRVPFVWISNSFSNTGVEYSRTRIPNGGFAGPIADGFQFQANPQNQYVPSSTMSSEIDVIDRKFKFPQVFRANLAAEQMLPGGIKGTLEGLYSKTLNNIAYKNLKYSATGENTTVVGLGNRPTYASVADASNYTGIILLTNTNEGYTYNLTGKLEKNFDFGLNAMIAYTLGQSKGINDGTSSQALSNWQYNEIFLGNDFSELAYTDFDVRHRLVGNLSYKVEYAKHFATTVSLLYNGQSGSRYSLLYSNDVNGDTYNNDLVYIPTDAELAQMNFTNDEQKADFSQWVNANSDIAAFKGKYIPRNGLVSAFEHHFDLHLAQDFYLNVSGQRHTLQVNFDILNVGNLLNRAWGLYNSVSYNYSPISYNRNTNLFGFNKPSGDNLYNISDYNSRWRAQLGVKYIF